MEGQEFSDVTAGTPQGGIMSPLLCNVALNGMEGIIRKSQGKGKKATGIYAVRYADDIKSTARTKEEIIESKQTLTNFLEERGLELSEKKTKILHITEGFDFLGFNIRRQKYNYKIIQVSVF